MASGTHVGVLLRAARKGRYRGGVGFREIDAELDLRKSTVEHWEAGRVKNLPIAQVMALAAYLEIPLQDLQEAALADASELRAGDAGRSASSSTSGVPAESVRDDAQSAVSEVAGQRHPEKGASLPRRSRDSR